MTVRSSADVCRPGNFADITGALRPLGAVEPFRRVIGDKAYDADSLRRWLAMCGTEAAIPSNATRRTTDSLDTTTNTRRNLVERRIATRYDRLARNYVAAIIRVATVAEWAK
jgi:hypothetical protein